MAVLSGVVGTKHRHSGHLILGKADIHDGWLVLGRVLYIGAVHGQHHLTMALDALSVSWGAEGDLPHLVAQAKVTPLSG